MSQAFDPYHKWLGILPKDQPPHHYRLLGIEPFESDGDVISHAADRQMAHLKSLQTGEYAELTQELLGGISAAKICLLDANKKSAYDQQLKRILKPRQKMATAKPLLQASSAAVTSVQSTAWPVESSSSSAAPFVPNRDSSEPVYSRRRKKSPVPMIVATVIGLIVIVGIVFAMTPANTVPRQAVSESSDAVAEPPEVYVEPTPQVADVEDIASPASSERESSSDDGSLIGEKPDDTALDESATAEVSEQPQTVIANSDEDRLPIPDAESQEAALKVVRSVFEADFKRAQTPDQKRTFARQLIQAAIETEGDPTAKYVLLRVARDAAASSGNADLAIEAAINLAERYEVDLLKSKVAVLIKTAKFVSSKDDHVRFVSRGRSVVEEAAASDQYKVALELADAVLSSARKTDDLDLIIEVVARHKALEIVASEFGEIETALALMKEHPDDFKANLIVGRHLCFSKDSWADGLPMLAKGSDAELRAAAEFDLTNPTEGAKRVEAGDLWWVIAEKTKNSAKEHIQRRAAYWYEGALPELDKGINRLKVETRLAAIQRTTDSGETPLQTALEMKVSALGSLSRKARTGADRRAIAEQALALVDEAVVSNEFDMAGKLIDMALPLAQKARDKQLIVRIVARKKEIGSILAAYPEVKEAEKKLESDPTDPDVNLMVGRFRCLLTGDWETGLPMLALGSDAELKELAVKELRGVSGPDEETDLGDGWWSLAEKEEGTLRARLRERAAYWYQKALPGLVGLEKDKIEERLKLITVGPHDPTAPEPYVLRFTSRASLKNIVVEDARKCGIQNGMLVTNTKVLYGIYFETIERVTIHGGIVSPGTQNFRLSVGPINMILNWEGANENHFRYAERIGADLAHNSTTPWVLKSGRIHEIVVKQDGNDILVVIDGNTHSRVIGKRLYGTVCVYPKSDARHSLMVRDIMVKGKASTNRRVATPSHRNFY